MLAFADRAAPSAEWRLVHRVADSAYPAIERAIRRALLSVRVVGSEPQMGAFEHAIREDVMPLLLRAYARTGQTIARTTRQHGRIVAKKRTTLRTARTTYAFNVTNPRATKWAHQHAAKLITNVTNETKKTVNALVEAAFEDQVDVRTLASQISKVIPLNERQATGIYKLWSDLTEAGLAQSVIDRRVEMAQNRALRDRSELIARTEVLRASNAGQLEAWQQAGDEGLVEEDLVKVWITTPDDRLCSFCEEMDGEQAEIDEEFSFGEVTPPLHPQCLHGDSFVLPGQGITACSKRWFDGDLVVVRIAEGRELRCTPNHPILTPSGWVAAGLLNIGDNVICDGRSEWRNIVNSNHEKVPARIEDIANALIDSGQMTTTPVPVSSEDFHGDGTGSKIAIIGTNWELRDNNQTAIQQHMLNSFLQFGLVNTFMETASGDFATVFNGQFATDNSAVGRVGLESTLLKSHLTPLHQFGFTAAANRNVALLESSNDDTPVNVELVCQLLNGRACEVFVDQVVYVNRYSFHGHVYNLETEDGWYSADGIITHNCRCAIGLEPRRTRKSLAKGDLPGHEFRGNQWTGGRGEAGRSTNAGRNT